MFDDSNAPTPVPPDSVAPTETPVLPPAVRKFQSCRWRHQPENGSPLDYCTHRDVQPMTGTTGFDAQAWCPDCTFYKVRRIPRKRSADDYGY